jgi:HSP20 family molecular chaperone IbpA
MVLSTLLNPVNLLDLNSYFKDVFYNYPENSKPPWSWGLVYDENQKIEKLNIFIALAGIGEEFVKCYEDKGKLIVDVDASNSDLPEKFKINKFMSFTIDNENYDISKSSVSFDKGLFTVSIPVREVKSTRKLLFGKE